MPQLIEPATGKLRDVSDQDVAGAIAAGWTPEATSDVDRLSTGLANEANYGGVTGGINATLAGVARGATLGASDVAGRILGGQDTARTLEGLQAQNPIASGAGEFAGMLLPAVVTGGAAMPAGIASMVGRRVTAGATRAGAGLLERAAGHAVGAAAEGALYGGGQYLSQTALEDKPLSAEGFVGSMGRGALFAAPVGGAFALGGETLLRARSLFPRSQITAEAGIAAKTEASSALHESLADGDAMAATARQKIALADAQAGQAGAKTQVTRAVFGGGDPAELGVQVDATANKAQFVEALGKLENSQAALKDWIASGGEDELADQVAGMNPPSVPRESVPVGEFGAPGQRGIKSQGEIAQAAADAGAPEASASSAPTEPAPATRVLPKGTGRTPASPALDDISAVPATEPAGPDVASLHDIRPSTEGVGNAGHAREIVASDQAFSVSEPGQFKPLSDSEFKDYKHNYGHAASNEHFNAEMYYSKGGDELINPALRSGKTLDAEEIKLRDGLDDALKLPESRLKRPATLYRGMSDDPVMGATGVKARFENVKPGDVVEDPAYTSTAYSENAKSRNEQVVFTIQAPAGMPALPIRSKFSNEGELLLPRNTKLRVDKVEYVPVGERWNLPKGEYEILPDKSTRIRERDGSVTVRPPIQDIHATVVSEHAPVTIERAPRVGLDAPIELLTKRQIGEYQDDLNKAFDTAKSGTPEYKALSEKWDAAAARLRGIDDGTVKVPDHEYVPRTTSPAATDSLTGLLRGTQEKLNDDASGWYHTAELPPDPEKIWPWNEAFDTKRVESLSESMKAGGWSGEPIVVVDSGNGKYRALTGSHRLAAAAEAGIKVPAVVMDLPDGWKSKWDGLFRNGKLITDASDAEELLAKDGVPDSLIALISERPDAAQVSLRKELIDGLKAKRTPSAIPEATDTLTGLLRGTKAKLDTGASLNDIGAPGRAEYAAGKAVKTEEAAAHFRGKANAENYAGSDMAAAERAAQGEAVAQRAGVGGRGQKYTVAPKTVADAQLSDLMAPPRDLPTGHDELGKMFGIDLAPKEPVGNADDLKALLSQWSDQNAGTAVDRGMRGRMGTVADDAAIERLLQKRPGKNVDIGPQLERAAKVIGDHEAASADVAELLGADAPKSAADRAQSLRAARAAQAETQGASTAKAAQGIQDRAVPALADKTAVSDDVAKALQKHESAVEGAKDKAIVSMQRAASKASAKAAGQVAPAAGRGIGGKLADVGTAFEVLKALGVHVPVLSAIPVIGPVLGLFLKARAVLGILGRKGGSIGRDVDGLIASKAAATRDRISVATQAILTGAGKGALRLSEASAGPAVTLGYKLFPGSNVTNSKDPQKLYEARMDEIARAQQPGAIDHAIADRYQTSDPNLHDAIVAQTQRGISFLDSKAPKPSIMQAMIPGDGAWRPSKAQLDEWGKYVHAVGDPASVLEDLAKGHVTLEGAETLRVVYPELFAEGQKLLMQAAPEMQRTLPYPTRVAISILYRIPIDGSMQPGHLQYLQQGQQGPTPSGSPPGGQGAPPGAPGLTGTIKLGQSTMTALDRRAGS